MKALYLRTVYWFGLVAGGSVGHTAGVIHAMDKQVELDVISNDNLAGVNRPITIIEPFLCQLLPKSINEMLYSFRLINKLKNLEKYGFIYQRYSGGSFAGAYLSKKYKIPFILEFNSSDVWKLKNWRQESSFSIRKTLKNLYINFLKIPTIQYIEQYNLCCADLIVVVSDALKQNLVDLGIEERNILVNPNGIDLDKYKPGVGGNKIRKRYNIMDKTVIGFIGTFGQWHGVIEMAKAICLYFEQHPEQNGNVKFLLIGTGVLMDEVRAIIMKSPYKNNVIFTGVIPQDEAPAYLDECDIFLSPHIPNPDGTKFFGSPTKLFEYMAMGKGIIASDLGQIGQILRHKQTAYMVEPGNVKALAHAMHVLVNDKELRNELGRNARDIVSKHYTWNQHVAKILKKLKEKSSE